MNSNFKALNILFSMFANNRDYKKYDPRVEYLSPIHVLVVILSDIMGEYNFIKVF